MGCKITKDWSLQQGKAEWLLLTADFGSLQMRLTTQDTSINPSTIDLDQPCDPGLYSIYNRNTECADAHSNTGRIVFVDSIGGQLYVYTMDDGSKIKLYQDTKIPELNGKLSQDLKVGDTLEGKKIASIEHRSMTTKEFKSFTKDDYIDKYGDKRFAGWRRVSKTVNFGVLFGCTAPTLAKQLENAGYKEEEAEDYLNLTNNMPFYNELLLQNAKKPKPLAPGKVKFLAAGALMLEAYYKGFPGVQERARREKEFAWVHGYSRMWHGGVKHLPELRYMLRNAKGELVGADKKMWSSMFSNLNNEAGNAPIQCMESNIAIKTIINVTDYAHEWKLKSYLWNMVHDSEDWCIWKPELDLVCSLVNACSTWLREPHKGIDMCMDFSICDPSKGYQKNMYHGGLENPFKIKPIDEAIKDWNESHKNIPGFEPISWHGCSC